MGSNAVLKEILASLNAQQKVAVQFDHTKALQVIAGPGTGKTKVLTSRVAYLLLHHGIKPQDIIVATFTNKAAKEMIDRLSKMLEGSGVRMSDIMIGTFHSICLKILARFGHKIGLRKDWRIVDESEIDKIMEELIEKMPDGVRDQAHSMARKVNLCLPKKGTDEWAVHAKAVKKHISRLKAFAVIPEEYQKDNNRDQALAYFYEKYQAELSKLNALDFDDLLMYAFRLLSTERCLPYVQHVLVDEFQDTNGIQMDLMFLFAKANHHLSRGITVVGDPDQSIYAFRHALAQNFEAMSNKCPIECSRVVLVENYRSSQKILDTSETLIKQQSRGRTDRLPLHAQFDSEFAPVYIDFPAAFLEGPSLVREMLYLKALPNVFTFNDFAILVRQRRQIKSIETALIEHGIPYKIIRGHAFWELKEIVSMLNLLKCVFFDNERHAILSALQYPARGLGAASISKIKVVLDEYRGTALQGLKEISENHLKVNIPTKAMQVVKEFLAMVNYCQNISENPSSTTLSDIFDKLYAGSSMRHEYLYNDGKKKSERQDNQEPNFSNPRHKNVMILKSYFSGSESTPLDTTAEAKKLPDQSKVRSDASGSKANIIKNHIRDFFLSLSLFSTETNESELSQAKKEEQDRTGFVTISTIHGAKGLEWPVVFIPGCEEGIIPSVFGDEKTQDNDDDAEENEQLDSSTVTESGKPEQPPSPRKSQSLNADSSMDEERRMFFVAQTRAKHLLYHSAATGAGRSEGGPSRFLTAELLSTMADKQRLFDSAEVIKKFYIDLGRTPPTEDAHFQLRQLVQDYAKFIENRRERFIWNGDFVVNMFKFDMTKNVGTGYTSSFTTAAAHLQFTSALSADVCSNERNVQRNPVCRSPKYQKTSQHRGIKSPKKTFAPQLKTKGEIRLISPVKNTAPESPTGSPTKKASYAPTYRPSRNAPNALACKRKLFAPSQERPPLKSEISSSSRDVFDPPVEISKPDKGFVPLVRSQSKVAQGLEVEKENKNNAKEALKSKVSAAQRSKRRLYATPIDISDQNVSPQVEKAKHTPNTSFTSWEESLDTTAAELLHNPDDVVIDTRPIIASAKTLADAARKPTKSRERGDTNSSNQVKQENPSSQFDIFSQLSRAKKKAKLNDGEIIIID